MFVKKQKGQVLPTYLSCLDVHIPFSQELPDNSHVFFRLCRSQGRDHHSSVAGFVLMIHVADTCEGRHGGGTGQLGVRLHLDTSTECCLLAKTLWTSVSTAKSLASIFRSFYNWLILSIGFLRMPGKGRPQTGQRQIRGQ